MDEIDPEPVVDFFIVGAPKAGTTALFEYLKSNPQVFFPEHKEPHFFSDDYPNVGGRIKVLSDYHRLYIYKTQGQLSGDASVCYLASENAIKSIYAYNPQAKIIVMLRNPVDLFLSEHSQLLYSFYESEKNPWLAWELQEKRMAGLSIPNSCREPKMLNYRQTCALGSNLERVYGTFQPDQVLPIVFDDFVTDTASVYRQVLVFLGLPDDGRSEFPKINERKSHRSSFISRLLISPPGFLAKWHASFRRYIAVSNNSFLKSIERMVRKFLVLVSRDGDKPDISFDEYAQLQHEMASEVDKLSGLLGRELSSWKDK